MAYKGSTVRLPIGQLGLSGSRNPTQLQAGHFANVEGAELNAGLIQKEGGASKLNSSALASGAVVISGINYSPLTGLTRDAVFLSDGSIRKDTGAGTFATTLKSGLISVREPPPYFLVAGGEAVGSARKLMCFSSSNQVQAVNGDGATMANITTPPADWASAGNFPTFGVVHASRVWGGGNASDPHRIYYSTASDHENFTGAGSGTLSIFPGEGERLVGGVSFKGLLILFKYPRGVYVVTTTDPTPANWRIDKLSSAVGAVNQQSIVPIDNDVLYMDSGGNIHQLSATQVTGGVMTSNISQISEMQEYMRTEVNRSALKRAVGIWYGTKQQAIFAFPSTGNTDNNIRMTISMSDPNIKYRFLVSTRDTPISLWMRPESSSTYKPVHGDASGFVWLMDQDSRNKDGAAYTFGFESSNMDLAFADPRLANISKTSEFLELCSEPQGDWDLQITVYWDDVPGPPLLFNMGASGAVIGVFTLGTHTLSSTSIRSVRKRCPGSGRRCRIVATNVGLNETIAISDIYLSFHTTDERTDG